MEHIDGEIISHEILQPTIERQIMIDGDEEKILMRIDLIVEMKDTKDNDHVLHDITYLVEQNGTY